MQEAQVEHVTARHLVVVPPAVRPQVPQVVPEHPEEPQVLQDSVAVAVHLTLAQVTEETEDLVDAMAPVVAEVEVLSRQVVQGALVLQGTAW
jgi:copper(I)-binding protein